MVKNIRDWIHVNDHCKALIQVYKKGQIGHTYNIGADNEVDNITLVKKICKLFDKIKPRQNNTPYSSLIEFVTDRPGHDEHYAINSSKIKNELNWSSQKSLDKELENIIDWHINNPQYWIAQYKDERLGVIKS